MLVINQFDKKHDTNGNPVYLFHAISIQNLGATNVTKQICEIVGCRYNKKGEGCLKTYRYFNDEVKDSLLAKGYDLSDVVFVGI